MKKLILFGLLTIGLVFGAENFVSAASTNSQQEYTPPPPRYSVPEPPRYSGDKKPAYTPPPAPPRSKQGN